MIQPLATFLPFAEVLRWENFSHGLNLGRTLRIRRSSVNFESLSPGSESTPKRFNKYQSNARKHIHWPRGRRPRGTWPLVSAAPLSLGVSYSNHFQFKIFPIAGDNIFVERSEPILSANSTKEAKAMLENHSNVPTKSKSHKSTKQNG